MQSERGIRRRGRPPASAQATERPKADLLLDAALSAFATSGFEGASLRRIAADVGVDVALITHNFGSKLDLWHAAIDHVSDRLLAGIAALPDGPAHLPPAYRLATAMDRMVDITCDTPHLAQFVMREIALQDDRFGYIYEKLVQPIREAILPLIARACEAGALGKVDPDFYFLAFTGSIVTTVASRPFMAGLSPASRDEMTFRQELKRAVLGPLSTQNNREQETRE